MLLCRDRAGTVHRPCRECAGTDRAGTVHQVFIVQGPCMECSFVVAWTVQGPCIDCPELNDQLTHWLYSFMPKSKILRAKIWAWHVPPDPMEQDPKIM